MTRTRIVVASRLYALTAREVAILRSTRRLACDVILLDGEQDAAPSLADMAKRARKLLDVIDGLESVSGRGRGKGRKP